MSRNKKGGLSFYYREKRITREKIINVLGYLFWIFLAVLLAFVFVYSAGIKTTMFGSSMEPCLYNGQNILINRIVYNFSKPKMGDVIIYKPNGNESTHFYVKRVVAVPGDTIMIKDGYVVLNGEVMTNLFSDKIAEEGVAAEEIVLAEDEYFVMGDNCNNSEDSRSANLGNVKIDTIYGKAWFHMATKNQGVGFIK